MDEYLLILKEVRPMKTFSTAPFSAVAFSKKQWQWITGSKGDSFPLSHGGFRLAGKLLVTNSDNVPVMVVHIFVIRKDISCFVEQELLKSVITNKVKASGLKGGFSVNFMRNGLKKIGLNNEAELIEKFQNLKELIILLNDTNKLIEIGIPEKMTIPKTFSSV